PGQPVLNRDGLPWWYFEKHGGPFAGHRLQSLDPDGVLADSIPVDNIVGTVTFPAGEIASPGVVRHTEGNRFPIGELDGSRTERAQQLVDLLTRAGVKSFVITDLRA
ncbi:MAG: oxidoreductase, partial [Gammaproteobacteria bacterium]|nr:oxidoreductase [Gammaproteobacteria bacterium]